MVAIDTGNGREDVENDDVQCSTFYLFARMDPLKVLYFYLFALPYLKKV